MVTGAVRSAVPCSLTLNIVVAVAVGVVAARIAERYHLEGIVAVLASAPHIIYIHFPVSFTGVRADIAHGKDVYK